MTKSVSNTVPYNNVSWKYVPLCGEKNIQNVYFTTGNPIQKRRDLNAV